ncbi:MAG: hypothetical protein A3D95_10085 [Betaproteobacteria bacterium RIFCSPHIGHO2_12_FULL_69_13]|nr:MAG: hypothetical protein A3D95_10085 [Betaproteobacteria bacterium RIFCSPHIGHO2_12_FULL_69_13]OGA71133.1 MAG: hypothetical protein A3G83_00415 [Betaproteobacteria bacterium RIFCSPLOWO2_12_FULL_68_20]
MTTPDERAERERAAYNGGKMLAASSALHRRFSHAFECPNTWYGEAYWAAQLARVVPAADALEIGCFDGRRTIDYLELKPRRLIGIDISEVMVRKAVGRGLDARVMDAQRLEFADASFDVVLGRAILHHLDYQAAIGQIHRVLRPGGTAVFMEPLRDNPAWQLFRALTPEARTPDEQALSRQQLQWADRLFGRAEHCFIGLASTAVGMLASFLPVAHDNAAARLADGLDRALQRTPLRYWMRYAILVWEKSRR